MFDFSEAERWCEVRVLMSGKPVRTLVCTRDTIGGTWKFRKKRKYHWGVPEGTRCVLVPGLRDYRVFPGGYVDEQNAEELVAEDPDTWVIE